MNIHKDIIETENTVWYPISLFYARNNWAKLLLTVKAFYEENKKLIDHFSIYISSFQGERLDIVISSSKEKKEILYNNINKEFNHFLSSFPSEKEDNFPYGKEMWRNYDNNSMEWNRFNIQGDVLYDSPIRNFIQYTSLLILDLYDDDDGYNIIALLTFFWIKIYKLSIPNSEKEAIDVCIQETNQSIDENMEILNQYWVYPFEGTTAYYYKEWSRAVEEIYKKEGSQGGFNVIYSILDFQLDCSSTLLFQVSKLIKEWTTLNKSKVSFPKLIS